MNGCNVWRSKVRVYNRKNQLIGWLYEEEGSLVLHKKEQKNVNEPAIDTGTDVLHDSMLRFLFWMLAANIISIFGVLVFTKIPYGSELHFPLGILLSPDNLMFTPILSLIIQFGSVIVFARSYRALQSLVPIYLIHILIAVFGMVCNSMEIYLFMMYIFLSCLALAWFELAYCTEIFIKYLTSVDLFRTIYYVIAVCVLFVILLFLNRILPFKEFASNYIGYDTVFRNRSWFNLLLLLRGFELYGLLAILYFHKKISRIK